MSFSQSQVESSQAQASEATTSKAQASQGPPSQSPPSQVQASQAPPLQASQTQKKSANFVMSDDEREEENASMSILATNNDAERTENRGEKEKPAATRGEKEKPSRSPAPNADQVRSHKNLADITDYVGYNTH